MLIITVCILLILITLFISGALFREIMLKKKLIKHISKMTPIEMQAMNRERGIVIVGGGELYGPMTNKLVERIRAFSTIDIEIWSLDHDEAKFINYYKGVHQRIICDLFPEIRFTSTKRKLAFRSKAIAVVYSQFKEVLLIDADTIPLCNLEQLFEIQSYKETGHLLWTDVAHYDTRKRYGAIRCLNFIFFPPYNMFNQLGIQYKEQFESGLVLLNKLKCQSSLSYLFHLNYHHRAFYNYFYGDKDSYAMALALGQHQVNFIKDKAFAFLHDQVIGIVYVNDELQPIVVHCIADHKKNVFLDQFNIKTSKQSYHVSALNLRGFVLNLHQSVRAELPML